MIKKIKTSNLKTLKYSVPKGLSEQLEFIASLNQDFKRPEVAYFKYLYIVNKITRQYIEQHWMRDKADDYKGCTINLGKLTKIIGTKNGQTIRIINDLISYDIIQRTGNYLKGSQSYNYILANHDNLLFEFVASKEKFRHISDKIILKSNELHHDNNKDLILYKDDAF